MLLIDNFWDVYPYYHQSSDTIDKINTTIAVDIMRMNVAALASFMNATTHTGMAATSQINWVIVLYCLAGLVMAVFSL